MNTALQLSVIYLAQEKCDINEFDFFIRMIPTKDKNIVSVSVVPRFPIDGKVVKNIRLSIETSLYVNASDILQMLAHLQELKSIVADVDLTTKDAKDKLEKLLWSVINGQ